MNKDLYDLCISVKENCNETDDYFANIKLLLNELGVEDKYIFNEIINQYTELVDYNNNIKYQYNHVFKENKLLQKAIKRNFNRVCTQPTQVQRTPEWFEARRNRVTASEISALFTTKAKWNELLKKKCVDTNNSFFGGDAILHGKKFETIVQYEYMIERDTNILEFGCLIHRDYSFIGASPDGIDEKDYTMIEIKCPTSRKIRNLPTFDYWCQMQLQMEVANLNKCIFIESKIIVYENKQSFLDDTVDKGNSLFTKENKKKGAVIVVFKEGQEEDYIYPDINIIKLRNQENLLTWVKDESNKLYNDITVLSFRVDYYYIEGTYEIMIYRNRSWFYDKLQIIKQFWNEVLESRENKRFENEIKKVKKQKPCLFDKCLFD